MPFDAMSIEHIGATAQPHSQNSPPKGGFSASQSVALGKNADFSVEIGRSSAHESHLLVDVKSETDTASLASIEKIRYKLLRTCRDAVMRYGSKDHRLTECHHGFVPDKKPTIANNIHTKSSHFTNVKKCNRPTCPVCSVKVGIEARDKLRIIMAEASRLGLVPVLMTLTGQHDLRHSTDESVQAMVKAWKDLSANTRFRQLLEDFGIWGYARGADETFSPKNGAHYHWHVLLLVEGDKFNEADWENRWDDRFSLYHEVSVLWEWQLAKSGRTAKRGVGVNFQTGDEYIAQYIAKTGKAPKESRFDLAGEITAKTVKLAKDEHYSLFELMLLAHVGDVWATRQYAEYIDATKNQQFLSCSEKVDDLYKNSEIDLYAQVEEPEPQVEPPPKFEIPYDAWRVARNHRNRRADWLKLHQEKRYKELLWDVAHCEVLGKFQYMVSSSKEALQDKVYAVTVINLQGKDDYIEDIDIGYVRVENGKAVEVKICQSLESGYYGRFVEDSTTEGNTSQMDSGTSGSNSPPSAQV